MALHELLENHQFGRMIRHMRKPEEWPVLLQNIAAEDTPATIYFRSIPIYMSDGRTVPLIKPDECVMGISGGSALKKFARVSTKLCRLSEDALDEHGFYTIAGQLALSIIIGHIHQPETIVRYRVFGAEMHRRDLLLGVWKNSEHEKLPCLYLYHEQSGGGFAIGTLRTGITYTNRHPVRDATVYPEDAQVLRVKPDHLFWIVLPQAVSGLSEAK